jgi:hypothetical protein
MGYLTSAQIDLAVSFGLSAVLYGAMGFVGVSVGTAVADPLVGAILGVLVAGYVSYHIYDWAIEEIEHQFYKWRLMDLAVVQAGHLIGGIVGGISIVFAI